MRYSQTTTRYGFGGQEKDEEIYGSGVSYTAEFWQYDTRLARRWNVDPVINPSISPYAVFGGNPVRFVDPDGDTVRFAGEAENTAYQEYRTKVFSNDKKYSHIQKELTRLENADEVFKIRIGDNITNKKGGGNFVYNKKTENLI